MPAKKKPLEVVMPWDTDAFREAFDLWQQYKSEQFNFRYKSAISAQGFLNNLAKISEGVEATAIAIIHQSIANGYMGCFPLKTQTNVQGAANTGQTAYDRRRAEMAERIQKRADHSGLFPG